MSAEPVESVPTHMGAEPYEVIHLGGEAAAATAELDEWEAAGRPGAKSHQEFMAELFRESR